MNNIENIDIDNQDFVEVEQLQDGSTVYEIQDNNLDAQIDNSFYANLALNFNDSELNKLSASLLDAVDEDIDARQEWLDSVNKVKQYLGFSLEDFNDKPFPQSTRTYDTTLATALIRFYATTRAELLPQSGPAGFEINGESNEELEQKGTLVRDWLNYFLTVEDVAYYSDYEKFLLYLGLYGSGFKKVYFDEVSNKPLSRFIMPEDFVIDGDCTSVLESHRITHILHLSKREIILNLQKNTYRDVDLPYLKFNEVTGELDEAVQETSNNHKNDIDLEAYSKRTLFPIYEIHTYLNLSDYTDFTSDDNKDIPLPYIVTIDKTSKEILSIRRNWEEGDREQKRANYFVQYNYLPGFGVYGIGLAHLLGTNAISLTKILRQLVDAGSYKNLPGGLRQKNTTEQEDDIVVGPGQFVSVNTGGVPFKEAFMPLPYGEPSAVLKELRLEVMNQCKELGSTSELGMLESKEDIPTGTMLAALENNNRIQSSVLRSIHSSFSYELRLIDKLFRKSIVSEVFYNGNSQQEITAHDFRDEVKIIPISNPAVNSNIHKILKAESILKIAQTLPNLHNMREVLRMNYEAQGISEGEINKIIVPQEKEEQVVPLDPVSENINVIKGKALKAAIWQDHAAHKMIHGKFAQSNPDVAPALMAHIKEHEALEYSIEMQKLLGYELPPLEQIQDPVIQNTIAMNLAVKLGSMPDTSEQERQSIDPNQLIMADIQQKEAETVAKERIAKLKTETDVFKAQLDFEKEKAKIESNEDIAELKAETELKKSINK